VCFAAAVQFCKRHHALESCKLYALRMVRKDILAIERAATTPINFPNYWVTGSGVDFNWIRCAPAIHQPTVVPKFLRYVDSYPVILCVHKLVRSAINAYIITCGTNSAAPFAPNWATFTGWTRERRRKNILSPRFGTWRKLHRNTIIVLRATSQRYTPNE